MTAAALKLGILLLVTGLATAAQANASLPDVTLSYASNWCIVVKDSRIDAYSTDERPARMPRRVFGPAALTSDEVNGRTVFRATDADGNKIEIQTARGDYAVDIQSNELGIRTRMQFGELAAEPCDSSYSALLANE